MIKHSTLAFILCLSFAAISQQSISPKDLNHKQHYLQKSNPKVSQTLNFATRAAGDILFQEDFANGLSGNNGGIGAWTTSGIDGNLWLHDLDGSSGNWRSGVVVASPTASNGFMIFDGDLKNTPWDPNNIYIPEGQLISPIIDLSANTNGVLLEFYQAFSHCCDGSFKAFVEVTTDGFITSDTFAVNAQGDANNSYNNIVGFNITSAISANPSNVQIRFNWPGLSSHYYWQVDDIKLLDNNNNDLVLSSDYLELKPSFVMGNERLEYYQIPLPQIGNIEFESRVYNRGGKTQTNSTLEVKVNGTSVATSLGKNITSDNFDTLTTSPYVPPATIGNYNMFFEVTSDSSPLSLLYDDTTSNSFQITDWTFARDNGVPQSSFSQWSGQTGQASIGCYYEINAPGVIRGIDVALSVNSDTISQPIFYVNLFKFDAINGWIPALTNVTEDNATSSNVGIIHTMRFWNEVVVAPGEIYLAVCGHYGTDVRILMAQQTIQGTVLGESVGSTSGFFSLISPNTPIVRLNMDTALGLASIKTIDDNFATLEQSIPNPSSGLTKIRYSLEKAAQINFEIIDVTGKKVYTLNEGNKSYGKHEFILNAADFANGVYYYSLIVNNNKLLTKKLVFSK